MVLMNSQLSAVFAFPAVAGHEQERSTDRFPNSTTAGLCQQKMREPGDLMSPTMKRIARLALGFVIWARVSLG
jgi:hypothetical protein